MKSTMKAIIINAPGDYGMYEVPVPPVPEGGLLLKVLACGLCGSDLRTLRYGHHRVTLPFIIGHEVCGAVVNTGKGYEGIWQAGDILAAAPLVYCGTCIFCRNDKSELCIGYKELAQAWPGGLAEYMAIPEEAVKRGTLQKIPAGMNPEHATLIEPLSSCVNAGEKGRISRGDTVVIIGAGPVGTLHLELSKVCGVDKIIVADIDDSRLEMIKTFEPDHIINASRTDLVKEVQSITNGLGADVIITANPDPQTHIQALEMAKKGGRILLFGGLPADKAMVTINMNTIHYNALELIGTTIFAPRHNRMALQLITDGKISADRFITHRLPLAQFNEGARLALEGKARKVVFIP